MHESIAYCGLDCDSCPAYLATRSGDMEALARVAERWTADTGREVRAEAILCDGCKSGSERINTFCAACEIRDCAHARGLDNCAGCEEYACERLRRFIAYEGEGKANLDRILEGLKAGD
jgi:Protein of unknown function (DUF3795)